MVEEIEETIATTPATIPEELYNLTQLAEVTLAAGKLSTTNISKITDYINNEKTKDEQIELNIEKSDSINNHKKSKLNRIYSIKTDLCSSKIDDDDDGIKITSNNKNNNNHNQIEEFPKINQQKSIPKVIKPTITTVTENGHFFSSSDDDSNYYSHKIFDRKKSRRSTFSDNSQIRFDELSCSSIPSSCGDDLNFLSSGGVVSGSSGTGSSRSSVGSDHHSLKVIGENSVGSLEDDHVCPDCGKKYSTSSNLARHRQTHRSILDKKARRCPYCEKVYVSMPAYSMHVRTHNQGCKCDHCGKCFSRPWLLQGHIRTHTGEKPFKCSTCNKAFADKSNLRAHIQTHSNTKPHACTRCGKSFALKSYLYKHEESSCMRNNTKLEKDRTVSSKSVSMVQQSSKMSTTKSTLASKILQKESQNLMDQQHQHQHQLNQSNSNHLFTENPDWDFDQHSYRSTQDIANDDSDNNNSKDGKSYTTLTSPILNQTDGYDGFARISVIRPPISSTPSNFEQHQVPGAMQMNFYQENPVDFSPKNTFSHSTKTSPFELTSTYAMVA